MKWLKSSGGVAFKKGSFSSVGAAEFDRIAAQAMGTPWVPRNPRGIDGPAQVKEILELAA